MNRTFQISALAVVILVLLRIGIGWHFLHAGLAKLRNDDFSAVGYLMQARGPFADLYRGLIPDASGEVRLNVDAMRQRWSDRLEATARHFKFDNEQRALAKKSLDAWLEDLDGFLRQDKVDEFSRTVREDGKVTREYKPGIYVYTASLAQWKTAERQEKTTGVPFERQRHHAELVKLRQQASPWLAQVDQFNDGFNRDLTRIVTAEQVEAYGPIPDENSRLMILESLTKYTLPAIGLLLMLGLVTRLAAFGGAVFMLTAVILHHIALPGYFPTPPPSDGDVFVVTKDVIEILVLFLICVTPVGRWAGLDYIGHGLFARFYGSVREFVTGYTQKVVTAIIAFFSKYLRKRSSDAT